MKNKAFFAAILSGIILLTGCNKSEIPSEAASAPTVEDPMKTPVEQSDSDNSEASGGFRVIGSYGHGFSENDVDFSGEKLVLTPTVTGDENPTILGAMAFVDGFPQSFSLNASAEKNTLAVIETTPSEVEYSLELDAGFDNKLDTHYAAMLYILEPNFVPKTGTTRAPGAGFGIYHSGSHWYARRVDTSGKSVSAYDVRAQKAKSAPFTAEQIEEYKIDVEANRTLFDLFGDSTSDTVTLRENNTVELTFAAYTTNPKDGGNYRITFYKNHELCGFNGDYNCLDITLEGKKMIEKKIVLYNLHAGDFVYCVAMPLFEGGLTDKSVSKIVVSADDTQSAENPGNKPQTPSGTGVSESINTANSVPQFVIGDRAYFLNNRGEIILFSTRDGINADKSIKIENFERISRHGEYISLLTRGADGCTATVLDKDLNIVKSRKIDGIFDEMSLATEVKVDFDIDRIAYIYHGGSDELRVCGWDSDEFTTIMSLSDLGENGASYFSAAALSEDFVAFTAGGRENGLSTVYYGIADFSGKSEIHCKDGIATPQTNGSVALWADNHVNKGELPSGNIILYNGKFKTVNTQNKSESQRAFLCDTDTIYTITEFGSSILRKYTGGELDSEMTVGSDLLCGSIIEFSGKVFAFVTEDGVSKCKIWG